MSIDSDIKFLIEWLNMPEEDPRNNTRVVKLKLQRVLNAIRK
jgi:hypothetical protein